VEVLERIAQQIPEGVQVSRACLSFRQAIEESLESAAPMRRARRGEVPAIEGPDGVRQLRRRCWNLSRKLRRLNETLSKRQERKSFRLAVVGMVRAGLSNPDSSARAVEEYCREALMTDLPQVGRASVCHLRHAFARIARNLCQSQVPRYIEAIVGGFVVFRHLRDEACMRVRSTTESAADACNRSRYSKVQNNSCTIHTDPYSERPWITELQALGSKDANTLCHSLLLVLSELYRVGLDPLQGKRRRFVHVLVADSVAANDVVARKLWYRMKNTARWDSWVYCLITIRCASHQANLAVRGAVGGFREKDPQHRSPSLPATSVRFYKYLLAEYHPELFVNLRE
jgi:hypothetical protein